MTFIERLFRLDGKTALVTGGATGIGRMIAEALVWAGAEVLIASRKIDACKLVADELTNAGAPGRAIGIHGDVSTESGLAALAEAVAKRGPRLDILVNNAGKTWGAELDDFPYSAWNEIFSVNVAGPFRLTQQLLPQLEAAAKPDDPARVVNLGSVVGTIPVGNGAYSYSASKAAVHHLTRILSNELAPRNITVNAIAPGPFISRMMAFTTSTEEKRARVSAQVPLGRLGRADDVSALILFLCGLGGSYVTGAVIPLDGGKSASTGYKKHSGDD